MSATTIDVGTEQQLNQAIASADAATSGSFDIVFTSPTITEGTDTGGSIDFGGQTLAAPPDLYAVNLQSGVSLTIDGAGGTLDGANTYRGFFVYAGAVTIENLTIANSKAQGGAGAGGGEAAPASAAACSWPGLATWTAAATRSPPVER